MTDDLNAQDFIGWGKLQDAMFDGTGSTATGVVNELLGLATSRFADLQDESQKRRAISAFVLYFAYQGLADQRDLAPATERQGGRTEQFSESQLASYRTQATLYLSQLEPYMPELKAAEATFEFGELYGGADIPAAFTRYPCDEPRRAFGARPED